MSRTHRPAASAGVSVLEAVVALTLGAFVLHLGVVTVQRVRTAQAGITERLEALEAFRVGRYVPRLELRRAVGGRDWAVDGDSLSLRAFRGTGLVCMPDGASERVAVSYRGDRQPDPAKDSVLLVRSGGGHLVVGLEGVGSGAGACGTGPGVPEVWTLDRPVPADVVLARLFERASYHFSAAALRYRIGASGRQPLTAEVWAMPATGWVPGPDRLAFTLAGRPDAGRSWTGFLAWTRAP